MLQEFREQHLIWDKANRRIHESVKANASDAKGRKLTVQVLNDGVVEDLTGTSLSLFWKTRNEKNKGLDAFDVVDATQGIFELYYTTGMLSNEGKLRANLVLVDNLGKTVSDAFVIDVSPGIDEEAVESSDSFTALTKALVDVQNLEQNYAPRLNEVTAQLAQKASINYVDAILMDIAKGGPNSGPQGPFMSLAALNAYDFPDGRKGTWLVFDASFNDGAHSFMWDSVNSVWKDLGVYQATGVPDESVTTKKLAPESVTTDKTNFAEGITNIADPSKIKQGVRYGYDESTNSVIEVIDSAYNSTLIPINEIGKYSLNRTPYSPNFSFLVNRSMNVISTLSESSVGNNIFEFGSLVDFVAFSALSSSDLFDLVMIVGDREIMSATSVDYPFNEPKEVEIIGMDNSKLEPHYSNVVNYKKTLLKNENWIVFSSGSIDQRLKKWTGSTQYSGMRSQYFKTTEDQVRIVVKGKKENLTEVGLTLHYNEVGGAKKYELVDTSTDDDFALELLFDAANYAVYKNAVDFGVLIQNRTPSGQTGSFYIEEIKVIEEDIENLPVYDEKLDKMLLNIGSKLIELDSQSSNSSESLFIPNGSGMKYKVQIGLDGKLVSVPTVPQKTLFMGNSILIGMNNPGGENFGMVASSSKNDYYHYVTTAILEKNPTAQFQKLGVGALEQGTQLTEYEAYMAENDGYFTQDLDLVVLQIGDNINTDDKETYFKQVFPMFLKHIRGKAPNARIIVVGTWFSIPRALPIISENTPKYGAELVTINDLRSTENEGYLGQIITYDDGSTAPASSNWLTHPGDLGMKRIAERIINQMNM